MELNPNSPSSLEQSEEVMDERSRLLASIANTIKDYRADDPTVARPTPDHVERWASQFAEEIQIPLLREIDHILDKTYFTKDSVIDFLEDLAERPGVAPYWHPSYFWKNVKFLRLQKAGSSQRDMLAMFDAVLMTKYGFKTSDCGNETAFAHVYLDDGIFTGNRLMIDLVNWVKRKAPNRAYLYIVTVVMHEKGRNDALNEICFAARTVCKYIIPRFRPPVLMLEDRRLRWSDRPDVLRPISLPESDENVADYVAGMHSPPVLRTRPGRGRNYIFSSEDGRNLVEQTFLKIGVDIRRQYPFIHPSYRPLGHSFLDDLGFGSTVVMYRNCLTNTPLAFWACDYPLFPRREMRTAMTLRSHVRENIHGHI